MPEPTEFCPSCGSDKTDLRLTPYGTPTSTRCTDRWHESFRIQFPALHDEPLSPELVPWVEDDGPWGPMLRHPLVYQVPLSLPGLANEALVRKRAALAEAVHEGDWHSAVFLHERAYRFKALVDYCTGRYDDDAYGDPMPLCGQPEHWDLAADVWVDSENIEQVVGDWRALLTGCVHEDGANECPLWLGTAEETAAFKALPNPIPAWRGGSVGDWSWTTDIRIAEFFSQRSKLPVRSALIPKEECFGYLTRRGESELLVRLTPEREALVYPDGTP